MRASVGPMLVEAKNVVGALRTSLDEVASGPLVVSGMLAEQLARELAAGAEPGAIVAGEPPRLRAAAQVHVIAGELTPADEDVVRRADRSGVPVVLVQLWPQAGWARPFVLTPFVVECSAGQGFPLPEIAGRIVEATENPVALARRIPILQESVTDTVLSTAAIRAAIIGTLGARSKGSRPVLTLEQVRMLGELRTLRSAPAEGTALKEILGLAAATIGAGFVFRGVARTVRPGLPASAVNAAVAAVGTWALGEVFRRLESRIPAA